MDTMASHITSLTVVYSAVSTGGDLRKHQALRVTGLCKKWTVTRKCFHLMTSSWTDLAFLLKPTSPVVSSIILFKPYEWDIRNGLFRRRSKKTSALRVTGLCKKMDSNAEMFPFDDVIMNWFGFLCKANILCFCVRDHIYSNHMNELLEMACLGADQRIQQSSTSLAFVRGMHRHRAKIKFRYDVPLPLI